MTPFYNCQISQFPLDEQNHQSHIPFLSLKTSTFSTSSYPYLLHDQQDHIAYDHEDLPHQQSQQQQKYVNEGDHEKQGPVKWMSSKMRIMRKMMNSDQTPKPKTRRNIHQQQHHDHQETVIRVCSDCSTTKTPLWRSGPNGPKSLCNACGIRQRKARRAIMAASADGKDKKGSDFVDRTVPFKKRCRFSDSAVAVAVASETAQRKICVEDVVMSLNMKSSANFQRVFPQDEKDAAILLMALSCGLL